MDRYQAYRAPERDIVLPLADRAALIPAERSRIAAKARQLVEAMREHGKAAGGIDQFLREYQLSSREGTALLCLAEAFLRIPDPETADLLIRDKLTSADWENHLGKSSSTLVNLSTVALSMTGKLLGDGDAKGIITGLFARLGEPVIRTAVRTAMRLMGEQFVMGRTIEEALKRSTEPEKRRFRHSFDMLGEGARTKADAARYLASYEAAIRAVGKKAGSSSIVEAPSVSIKLSALHPRYEPAQSERAKRELGESLIALAKVAQSAGVALTVDAEESERLMLSLEIIEALAAAPELKGWEGLGLAVQAYQKRALPVIQWVDGLGARTGRRLFVRLVKGAYWDSEIKRSQERGLVDYAVFTRKAATDVSYLACAREMLAAQAIFPAFATHNALTIATILDWAGKRRDFEFQRLHGMAEGLYETLLAEDARLSCRTYAPVGSHDDLLAYLVRRLLENGANTSFVNQIWGDEAATDELLVDPVDAVRACGGEPHPMIRLPADLFQPERPNSAGIDLSDDSVTKPLLAELAAAWAKPYDATSLVDGGPTGDATEPVRDPADRTRIVGSARIANAQDVAHAVELALGAHPAWDRAGPERRAQCLRRAADLIEKRRASFLALLVHEAGKTIPDAVADLREAVDFLRYYAAQAERAFTTLELPGPTGEHNTLSLHGRGVFACISPWNFPLAIFLGQISAALAAGNAVVAKPAPQTPLIAHMAVQTLYEAGVPAEALALVLGGTAVGVALVGDPRLAGIAFTGSTATAKAILRATIAHDGPIIPLIAETGGQNAMIVDSSALPEQVVADLLISAFQSAGQRCSAARVLYVQDDVADKLLTMLKGAMDELAIGDPGLLATDIGPVIDEAAKNRLDAHLTAMRGRVAHRLPAPNTGCYFGPALIEIDEISALKGEVFGPVLHVARWQAGHLDRVVDAINATGFGLTMGIHSRIGEVVEQARARAKVGNLYVNRSMIGAVVGVQPFGGEGLSGTGPKAGGPNYLKRFALERTVSVDTTSAGGNASLMSMAVG
jgi:RHH-type proline utilization regulon transcriptional repressor/proline dehydrogenase/delta 1-pyrroline-5-carboxylate dehydrogenase